MTQIKLIIAGSRDFDDYSLLEVSIQLVSPTSGESL